MRSILSTAPLDLVYLFLDFERLQVVKLGLMGLELGVKFVFARFFLKRVRDPASTAWGEGGLEELSKAVPSRFVQIELLALLCHQWQGNFPCDQTLPSRLCRLGPAVSISIGQHTSEERDCLSGGEPSVISSTSPLSPKHLRASWVSCKSRPLELRHILGKLPSW